MNSWMEGYASSNVYTKGYYRELNPNLAVFSMLCAGIRPPVIRNACELGFGYGLSLNFHASSQSTNWFGNDFDPVQKNYAQNLCSLSNNGAKLSDTSFAQLASGSDWPKFDFISLHGIWSWISKENQGNILKFISEHLNDDGIVFISYNTSPGCQTFQPIRELMKRKFDGGTKHGDPLEKRMKETVAYVKSFSESKGHYLADNSQVMARIEQLENHPPAYLLHEYMNDCWNIENFYSMSDKLENIKLKFVCSSNLKNTLNSLNYTEEQSHFLSKIDNRADKEYASDLYWAETFRTDYWAKGPNKISNQERWSALERYHLIQSKPREDIPKEFSGRATSGSVDNELYKSAMDLIEKAETVSLKDLSTEIGRNSLDAAIEVSRILLSLGFVQLVTSEDFIGSKSSSDSGGGINEAISRESVMNENAVNYLCSPRTGESLPVGRFTLIYLHVRNTGSKNFDAACLAIVHECRKNNEIFQSGGIELSDEKDAHEYVMREVGAIIDKYGPVYAKHGIVLQR